MEISGRISRQILLLSLLVLLVSMLIFPKRYGTNLADAPLIYVVVELVFYGFVIYLFNRSLTPLQLVSSAGLCLIYRFALGAALGIGIVVVYQWQFKTALIAGMGSYLPGMLLQIVAAPFILKPAIDVLYGGQPKAKPKAPPKPQSASTDSLTSIAASKKKGYSQTGPASVAEVFGPDAASSQTGSVASTATEDNGFDRATRYIGEDGSVLVAAVVDVDGLLLGNFSRRGVDAEDWAPFALTLVEQNRQVVTRLDLDKPEKIDIVLNDKKVIVACEEAYSLMVVADRATDDVLNIRINQGLEIIRKYVAERYSEELIGKVEKTYV
ncbi:MAG: hypothetical protein JSU74_07345 [Candidatus Zixiibacteriota bacterium]|nr:MAG: hypothetical protein JSU74_07345 [candidate division Zixibacteria bacterium]